MYFAHPRQDGSAAHAAVRGMYARQNEVSHRHFRIGKRTEPAEQTHVLMEERSLSCIVHSTFFLIPLSSLSPSPNVSRILTASQKPQGRQKPRDKETQASSCGYQHSIGYSHFPAFLGVPAARREAATAWLAPCRYAHAGKPPRARLPT